MVDRTGEKPVRKLELRAADGRLLQPGEVMVKRIT